MLTRARRSLPTATAVAALGAVTALMGGCTDAPAVSEPPADATLDGVVVQVAQTETCGCCGEWVAYVEEHGAEVEVTYVDDLAPVKDAAGIPDGLASCHTATVAGYTVEGHVPVAAIADLLEQAPAIDGITLPGMPAGSPGMPGVPEAPFEVASFTDGVVALFGRY